MWWSNDAKSFAEIVIKGKVSRNRKKLTFCDAQKGEIEVMSGLGVKHKWKKQITTTLQSTFVDIPHGLSYGLDV